MVEIRDLFCNISQRAFQSRLVKTHDIFGTKINKNVFLIARAGGNLRILQSDWLWERAEFFYLARQPGRDPGPGSVSLCYDLKFPFFDTESVYMPK